MAIADSLVARLSDPSLVVEAAFVAGAHLTKSETGATFDVINPSTGERLATMPDLSRAEAADAMQLRNLRNDRGQRAQLRIARACSDLCTTWSLPTPTI